MIDIKNIIIYQGPGTIEASAQDLKTLTEKTFFQQQKQSCLLWSSDHLPSLVGSNPKTTLMVIPGGQALDMLFNISDEAKDLFDRQFMQGAHGLFSCAGAYISMKNMSLFDCRPATLTGPSYRETLECLNFIPAYESLGPFFPVQPRTNRTQHKYLSCDFVRLHFNQQQSILPYAAGPTFAPIRPRITDEIEIVAKYTDKPNYSFFYTDNAEVRTLSSPPAILRKKATASSGGFFATAPHIEACVTNSQLLKTLQLGDDRHFSLDIESENALLFNPAKELERIEASLIDTFSKPNM